MKFIREYIGNMRFVLNKVSLTKKSHQFTERGMKKNRHTKNNQTYSAQFHQISDHLTNRKKNLEKKN